MTLSEGPGAAGRSSPFCQFTGRAGGWARLKKTLRNHFMAFLRFIIALALMIAAGVLPAAASGASRLPLLAKPPLGEFWFRLSLSGERTGFAEQTIVETADGFAVAAAGSVKMEVLGFSRQAASREEYRVNRDLSLRSFSVAETLDGVPQQLTGEMTAKGVKVIVRTGGEEKEKLLKTRGPVYPPPLVNLYPLIKGVVPGKKYRLQMLDIEAVKLKEVTMIVQGVEALPDGRRVVKFTNDLYPLVDNEVWVDLTGHTVRESVRDGLVETTAEEPQQALRFIACAALARSGSLLDYSLIRVDPPLADPAALRRLVLEITGIPPALPLVQGGGQHAERLADGLVRFSEEPIRPEGGLPPDLASFLGATAQLPVDDPTVKSCLREIVGTEPAPAVQEKLLVRWVAETVKDDAAATADSPLDALKNNKGNSLARARLFVTLARAAGIPSRVVSGIVYLPGKGFLYHSWAESATAEGWRQLDPTFGQLPVDATHVKLVSGDTDADLVALGGVVGMLQVRAVTAEGAAPAR